MTEWVWSRDRNGVWIGRYDGRIAAYASRIKNGYLATLEGVSYPLFCKTIEDVKTPEKWVEYKEGE